MTSINFFNFFQIMGYLTDVYAGGYTVFPMIGAFIPPTKGSVALWWNMDQVLVAASAVNYPKSQC
jgi:hypothetical protein